MSRFALALIAAATAAVAAIAVVALPAIGDSGTKDPGNDDVSAFAECLSAHGLPGAPTTAGELKPWLGRKEAADPRAAHAAMDACKRSVPDSSAPGPGVDDIISCVRGHGVDAPTAPDEFKRWVGEQERAGNDAVDKALVACKMQLAPQVKPGGPGKLRDCGGEDAKPPAAKPESPAQQPDDTNGT